MTSAMGQTDGAARRRFALPAGLGQPPLPEDQLRVLVRVLAAEPGLTPVWNWQRNGVLPTPHRPWNRSLDAPPGTLSRETSMQPATQVTSRR
jgi:hypothetical protein